MEKPHFRPVLLHPRYWLIWFIVGLWRLLALLPYPLLMALGRGVGRLSLTLAKGRARIARRNLELCFPELSELQREQLLRRNFESTGIALFETAMAWWWPRKRLEKLAHYAGLENLPTKGGAVLLGFHFTTLEISGPLFNFRAQSDAMYRPHKNPVYDYIQRRGRERWESMQAIPRGDMRGMVKALRKGRTVWYAPDQDYGIRGAAFVSFFGIPAATLLTTSKLAQLSKAPVIPFVPVRLPDNQGYRIQVYPPLENFPCGDEVQDAQAIMKFLEDRIREHPEQYLWAHRRFKNRPPGEPSVYAKGK